MEILDRPEFVLIVFMAIGAMMLILILTGFLRLPGTPGIDGSRRVSLPTTRVAPTALEPLALRLQQQSGAPAAALLWHMTRLPGLQVVAAKTAWGPDGDLGDLEAYFLYNERLFVLETRFFVTIALLGQPANEALFAEVEAHVQNYPQLTSLLWPFATLLRFLSVPRDPSRTVLDRYHPNRFQTDGSISRSNVSATGAGVDPLAEAEVYLASGHREMAIAILEEASQANPTRNDIRKRLFEMKAGSR